MICCSDGVLGRGPMPAQVMAIGIQPGNDELRTGYPFTGQNGKLLKGTLKSIGIDSDTLYYDNVLCGPTCTAKVGLARLATSIEQVNPTLILTLGAPATELLLGEKLGATRGQMLHRQGRYWMPIVQPIAALQGAGSPVGNDLIRDLSKIPFILDFATHSYKPVEYTIVVNKDYAQQILDGLPHDKPVAIDIETTELTTEQENPFDHELMCIGIGNEDFAYVFPASVCNGLTWPTNIQWLGHYAYGFDRPAIKRFLGVDLPIVWDTLLASYALDERRNSSINTPLHRLKPLCREYIGADNWESGKKEDIYKYNAHDVVHTARLHTRLTALMLKDNVYGLYTNILLPASKVLGDAQIYGGKIDIDEMARLMHTWIPKLNAQLLELQSLANAYGFLGTLNPNSPKQVGTLLFDILGLPGSSTAKEVLNELDHPFIQKLQDYRSLHKMLSTYIDGIRDDIKYDGRIHPKVLLHGTVTGRLSYTDPPVQTIPQEHTVGSLAELRRMFIPSDEDHVIMEADYSQLDIWMAACLSQDSNLLEDLTGAYWPNGHADYHSRVTEGVLNGNPLYASYGHGSKELADWEYRRYMAKKVTFGIMFMEGAAGLANKNTGIGCTVGQAKLYLEKWFARYPDFARWQRATLKEAHETGELVSVFGRKRRMPLIVDHRAERQLGNFLIQSCEGDCDLTSAIELAPRLAHLDSHILWLVHDSIVMDVSRKYLDEVAQLVKYTMEKPRAPQLLSVPVEIKIGRNWFDTEKVA